MNSTKAISFFTPTLNRTGSEIVLTNLISVLKIDASVKLISYYASGDLKGMLPNSIAVTELYQFKPGPLFLTKLLHHFEKKFLVPQKLKKIKNSIWYINTIVLPELIDYAIKWNIRVVVHTHELEQMFLLLTPIQLKNLIDYPELIIANSNSSAAVFKKFGRTKPIEICYPAIRTGQFKKDEKLYHSKRNALGIAANAMLWVMAGTLDSNKNPAYFLHVAHLVTQKNPDCKFMWIGGTTDREFEKSMKNKALELKLEQSIIWTGEIGNDFYSYFNCADGFMLCSKKESFSLVTLEALLYGLPIVANDCDGVREILRNDRGKIVQNEAEMAAAIIQINSEKINVDTTAYRKRAEEFDLEKIGNQWNKILTELMQTQ